METKFFGKYRATVVNNIDPQQRGRLLLTVPDILGLNPSAWAEACVPLAGPAGSCMGMYMVPPIGTGVWVEFEQGNPAYPIWVGCRWDGATTIPLAATQGLPGSPNIVLQSMQQHSLTISDMPGPFGGISIKSASGASIKVSDFGISIDNGKGATIELLGKNVDINKGGMTL